MVLNYNKRYSKIEFSRMTPLEQYQLVLNGKFYSKFLRRYWNREDKLEISALFVQYLCKDVLHFNESQIVKRFSKILLKRYMLDSMLEEVFQDNVFEALDNAYPEVFEKWMFFGKNKLG